MSEVTSTTSSEAEKTPIIKNGAPKSSGTHKPSSSQSIKSTVKSAKSTVATVTKSAPKTTSKPKAVSGGGPKAKVLPKSTESAPNAVVVRAEDTFDQTAKKVGKFFGALAIKVRKSTAFAKEGLEDIWAEAQSIRNAQGQ